MPAPACEIDYDRRFSLPFGVTPAPGPDAAYLAALGVDTGYVLYSRERSTAARPWPPRRGQARAVAFADSSGRRSLVPASTDSELGPSLTVVEPVTGTVGVRHPTAASARQGVTITADAASRYRWDAVAEQAAAFPVPAFDDGALVLRFLPAAAPPAPSGALTGGILESDNAAIVLASHAVGGDGERDRLLLRAPVVGLMRFERYRHLVLDGATVRLGAPSAAGAVVLQGRAGGATPPPGSPPALASHLVVIENVDRAAAVECVGKLAWCQLLRRAAVRERAELRADASLSTVALLRTWIDYLHVARARHRPAMPDPLPKLPDAVRQPFERKTPKPTAEQVDVLLELCLQTPSLRASLLDYTTTVFAPIVAGGAWTELGIAIPIDPANRPAAQKDAHRRLEDLAGSDITWLACFAGAPVGRPAPVQVLAGSQPPLSQLAQLALTPYHLEALSEAGQPAPATEQYGAMAVLRVIDRRLADQLLTTRDLLDALVKGTHTENRMLPPTDFDDLAAAGHPFAKAVDWSDLLAGRVASGRLEELASHRTPNRTRLARASLAYWTGATGLLEAGLWPELRIGAGAVNSPPTPSAPYLDGSTRTTADSSCGFDELDLAAVARARAVVRDGRTHTTDIPVPMFLALLDRESYRSLGAFERIPLPLSLPLPVVTGGSDNLSAVALTRGLVFPYGLDLLVSCTPASPTGHPLRRLGDAAVNLIPGRFRTSFPYLHGKLVESAVLAVDLEPLLLLENCLNYLATRRIGRNEPPDFTTVSRSRSLQWMCIALQMATFQWVHRQLSEATRARHTPGATDEEWIQVDELVSGAPPTPGPEANSDQRRRYIAYWSLVYLAFNTSPRTWNAWVDAVPDATIAAGNPVSLVLTYHRNAAPRVVEPGAPGIRLIGQRGHLLRFAAGLDAYLRLGPGGDGADTTDPADRAWAVL